MRNNMRPNPYGGGVNYAPSSSELYVRLRVLGKGSFGSAWLVERKKDRAQFVAKEVRIAGMKPADREAAKHEILMLRQLNHPNITRYVDHYESGGSLFIVMEFANGGDIMTKIQSRRGIRFTEKEVMHFFCQLLLALMYLHEKRILHRDLKTQNVFLTRDNVVKLGDFGISTVLRNTMELKKTVCGTPYYFSPELCQSKPYNNKSDVWALGCILYELTSLQHAFEGNNMKALVQRILKGVYPPVHSSYSSDLSSLIGSMLRLDPMKRPSAHELVKLPFVRQYLGVLQQQASAVAVGKKENLLVDPNEKVRQQQEAQKRVEEEKVAKAKREAEAKVRLEVREKEHQQRVEHIRQQMAAEVKQQEERMKRAREQAEAQHQRDQQVTEEKRRTELLEKLRRQEEDLKRQEADRKAREVERQRRTAEERRRVEEDRKRWEEEKKKQDEDRKVRSKRDLELMKKREQVWEKGMKEAFDKEQEQIKFQQQQQQQQQLQQQYQQAAAVKPPGAGANVVIPGGAIPEKDRAQVYRDLRAQADANRRRAAELEYGDANNKNKNIPDDDNNNNKNAAIAAAGIRPLGEIRRKSSPADEVSSKNIIKSNNNNDNVTADNSDARRQALINMRKEAEENRKRAAQAELPQRPPPSSSTSDNNVNKVKTPLTDNLAPPPASSSNQGTPVNSIDEQSRREVYFQMRREAEANRRRLLGQNDEPSPARDVIPSSSSSAPQSLPQPVVVKKTSPTTTDAATAIAAALVPIDPKEVTVSTDTDTTYTTTDADEDEDDNDDENEGVDGSVGLHKFLNNDAMAAEDDKKDSSSDNDNDNVDQQEKEEEEKNKKEEVEEVNNNNASPNNNNHNLKQSRTQLDYQGVEDAISHALDEENVVAPPDFEDDATEVTGDPFTFMLDGKTLALPNVGETDPLGHRIESLRFFLEKCFGEDERAFLKVYRTLCKMDEVEENSESESILEKLRASLTEIQRRFLPLVTQLIVCEDIFNTQQNHA